MLNAEFELAFNPTLEEALQKGVPLYFVFEFELLRAALVLAGREGAGVSTQYRVSYNALTRQYRVASGLLGQTFDALDEVERFLSRVTSRQVASSTSSRRARATRRPFGCGSTSTRCPSRSR